jgi:hypothetical protein
MKKKRLRTFWVILKYHRGNLDIFGALQPHVSHVTCLPSKKTEFVNKMATLPKKKKGITLSIFKYLRWSQNSAQLRESKL